MVGMASSICGHCWLPGPMLGQLGPMRVGQGVLMITCWMCLECRRHQASAASTLLSMWVALRKIVLTETASEALSFQDQDIPA